MIAPVTPLQQNCTIVWCAKTMKAAIIDPGGEVPRLMQAIKDQGLTLEKIWIHPRPPGSRRRNAGDQGADRGPD